MVGVVVNTNRWFVKGDDMRANLGRVCAIGLGITVALVSTATSTYAGSPFVAPEIDGTTIVAGIGLLSAGVLVLRARLRSKK